LHLLVVQKVILYVEEQKLEMSENSSYLIDAITLMKELDWILTLYERTLGLLYHYIGNIQMEKLILNKKR